MKKLLTITISLLLLSTKLYPYTLNRVAEGGARWPNFPIDMKLNPNNSSLSEQEVLRVISQSMNKWNEGVGFDVLNTYIDKSINASQGMRLNGTSSITFSNSFRTDSSGFDPDVTVAVGGQYGDGRRMTDGFVIFNAQSVAWDTDMERSSRTGIYRDDLETIAIHELGHVLGLGHSDDPRSVMSDARTSKIKRELAQDDIDGARYLASAAGPSGAGFDNYAGARDSFGGCGSIGSKVNSAGGGGNMGAMATMILLPMLALAIVRRKISIAGLRI